jgi:flagellar biosynthesis/type III secretory pathway chaperone
MVSNAEQRARVIPLGATAQTEPPTAEGHVRDLLTMLHALHESLKQLLELAGRKLLAMRAADTDALQDCATEERAVLQTLFARQQKRDAVLARLAQSLPNHDGRLLALPELAGRLPEPFSSRLRARSLGVRQTADALRAKNQLVARVARNLHAHIRAVFADMAKVNQEAVGYGPNGKQEQRNRQTWIDAVG